MISKYNKNICQADGLAGYAAPHVSRQTNLIIHARESMFTMNRRLKLLKTHYYTSYDQLGFSEIHLAEACCNFYLR
jgi:hypothetical protein